MQTVEQKAPAKLKVLYYYLCITCIVYMLYFGYFFHIFPPIFFRYMYVDC